MSGFYYADKERKPRGPVSSGELSALRAAGLITDDTLVVEDGGQTWRKFREIEPARGPFPNGPPNGATSGTASAAEIAHDRITAGIAKTSARTSATAGMIRDSIAATFRNARTRGEKAAVWGSAAGMAAFLLPWAGTPLGGSATGIGLAFNGSIVLLLYPLSLGAVLFQAYLNTRASSRDRILRARWTIAAGSFWFAAVLVAIGGASLFGAAEFGLYFALAATLSVAVGGLVQIAEQLPVNRV